MLPETASVPELLYTLLAVVGLLAAFSNTRRAVREWWTARRTPQAAPHIRHGEQVIGRQIVITRSLLDVILLAIIGLGLLAMSLPPNPAAAADWRANIGSSLITVISLAADGIAISNYFSNRRFDRVVRERQAPPHE